MTQEESQYLANDIEEIRKLPEWAQQRVGYGLSRPFQGRVNSSNPILVLHPGGWEIWGLMVKVRRGWHKQC
jgi:hypothetical protein